MSNNDVTIKFIKIMFKIIKLRIFSVESYTDNNNIKLKKLYLNIDSRDATGKICNVSLMIVSAYSVRSYFHFNISDLILF